jgi:hypothetical protein
LLCPTCAERRNNAVEFVGFGFVVWIRINNVAREITVTALFFVNTDVGDVKTTGC